MPLRRRISPARATYACEPLHSRSSFTAGAPQTGASASRTLRGITVSYTFLPKCSCNCADTCCASALRVVHRSKQPFDIELRIQVLADLFDRVHEIGEPLERVVLTLHRYHHR